MSIGFKDPEEQYPTQPYQDNQTTNKAAREEWEPYARLAADAPAGVDLGIKTDWQPKYPYNKVEETSSGHRIEVDDTPGGERLSYVHKDGSAIEMYPDAKDATTFLLNSVGKMVKLVGDDFIMIVNGNGDIHYNGNLNLNVTGDFNINCNNFTVTTQGKQVEEIKQEKIENFVGDRVVTTQGNKSEVVLGAYTVESMADTHIVSKGGVKISAEEDVEILAGTEVRVSAEERITTSAPENFMLGKCVTVAGHKGTIGGDEMIMYTRNIYGHSGSFEEGVEAPTFHGDLKGTAEKAIQAGTSLHQSYPDGVGPDYNPNTGTNPDWTINEVDVDSAETSEPNATNMTEALDKTKTLGVRKVTVDDDKISNSVKGSDGSSGKATTDNSANRPDVFGDGVASDASSVGPWEGTREEFYNEVHRLAKEEYLARGYSEAHANSLANLAATQAAIESGWGSSPSGNGTNFFGVKSSSGVLADTTEYINGVPTATKARFADHGSLQGSVGAYVSLLSGETLPQNLYREYGYDKIVGSTDTYSAIAALEASKYYTDKSGNYSTTAIAIYEKYGIE